MIFWYWFDFLESEQKLKYLNKTKLSINKFVFSDFYDALTKFQEKSDFLKTKILISISNFLLRFEEISQGAKKKPQTCFSVCFSVLRYRWMLEIHRIRNAKWKAIWKFPRLFGRYIFCSNFFPSVSFLSLVLFHFSTSMSWVSGNCWVRVKRYARKCVYNIVYEYELSMNVWMFRSRDPQQLWDDSSRWHIPIKSILNCMYVLISSFAIFIMWTACVPCTPQMPIISQQWDSLSLKLVYWCCIYAVNYDNNIAVGRKSGLCISTRFVVHFTCTAIS